MLLFSNHAFQYKNDLYWIYKYLRISKKPFQMGNCNKNNEKLSFTNFDDSVWSICKSKINA